MIWFTSDTHFGHENVLKFTDRPWETIQQMNSVIVANINARVGMNDELYILGDFSFKMTAQDAYGLRKKITCKKVHLVPGNHDKDWTQPAVSRAFITEPPICVLKIDGQKIVMSHFPMADWQSMSHGSWHLHGHIHSSGGAYNEFNRKQGLLRYDVGVDANACAPVSLDELRAWFSGVGEPCGRVKWPWWVNQTGDRQVERELAAYKRERAIFVTGDVHGGAEYGSSRFSSKSWPDGRTLSRDDVVVVAGDFGFVWDGSNTDRYWLDWFESKPWTTCFVDGNHENHRMLAELPETEWNGGRVHVARSHVLHLMRGEVFDIAGTTVLAMGGAASHDREWRKEGKSWWPEEMPSETEMERCRRNLDAAGWKVDYVVTHEAPADLAGDLCWECNRPFEDDPLQNFLGEIDRRLDFKTWFFGHYHDDEWRDGRHRLIYRDIVPVGVRREDEDREPVG